MTLSRSRTLLRARGSGAGARVLVRVANAFCSCAGARGEGAGFGLRRVSFGWCSATSLLEFSVLARARARAVYSRVFACPCCSAPFSSDLVSGTLFFCLKMPRSKETPGDKEVRGGAALPRVGHARVCAQASTKRARVDEEKKAFGTYASEGGTMFTCARARHVVSVPVCERVRARALTRYRVKKPGVYGGYQIVTEVRVAFARCEGGCALVERLRAQKVGAEGGLSREELLDLRKKKKADRMC